MKKVGIKYQRINKNNIKYLPEFSKDDINVIIKEFNNIKSASQALNIPERHLTKLLKLYKVNEYENAYDFIIRSKKLVYKKLKQNLFTEEQTRKILNGNMNLVRNERQKYLYSLIKFGYKTCRCERCGFVTEERLRDGAYPLLMTFDDKNENNLHIDNIKVQCYNCFHTYIGDIAYSTKYKKELPIKIEMQSLPQIDQIEDQWDIGWNLNPELVTEAEFNSLTINKRRGVIKKMKEHAEPKKEVDSKSVEALRKKFQENIGKLEKKL